MAVLKYKTQTGSYSPLSTVSGTVSDISIDSESIYLVDSKNQKVGDGIALDDLSGYIASSGNEAGGIVSVIDDDE